MYFRKVAYLIYCYNFKSATKTQASCMEICTAYLYVINIEVLWLYRSSVSLILCKNSIKFGIVFGPVKSAGWGEEVTGYLQVLTFTFAGMLINCRYVDQR